MPLFFFSVEHDSGPSICNDGAEFSDREAAWKELTRVFSEMVVGVSRKLGENSSWQMELLDASRQPIFRIRLVAETLA